MFFSTVAMLSRRPDRLKLSPPGQPGRPPNLTCSLTGFQRPKTTAPATGAGAENLI
jgi:hypothetical protein